MEVSRIFIMDDEKIAVVHGCTFSAGTSNKIEQHGGERLMPQRRGIPKGGRRLTPFGCSRHPDAKRINKRQASYIYIHLSRLAHPFKD